MSFAVLAFLNQRIAGSDDTVFQTQILPYDNIAEWIVYRYQTWSGRVFSEGFAYVFSPAPLYLWQLVSIFMYGLFIVATFGYYRLFSKNRSKEKDIIFLIVAICLPLLINKSVFAESVMWVTGAMFYFWTTAIALAAFYPITHYIAKKQTPHWAITCIGFVCSVVAASSQEQIGAVLLGLSLSFLVYTIITLPAKTVQKMPWYLISFCIVIGISLLVSALAPGNSARIQAETITWLPDFYTTPLLQRLEYGYRWILEAIINHSGYLLIASWVFMISLFADKKNKVKLDYIFIFVFALACVLAMSKGFESTSYWLNFYATWKPTIPNALASLNLIPWGVVLGCTVVAPLILFRKQKIGYVLSLLYLASFACTAIMLLSPTMYASGWRSLFVPSVLIVFTVYILFDRFLIKHWNYRYVAVGLFVSLAFSHYIFQLARLTN